LGRILVALVLTQAAMFLARPVTSYRALALGADERVIGLITASFAVVPLLVAVPLGRVAASILSHLLIPWMVRMLSRTRLIAVSAAGSALAIRLTGNRVGQVATPAAAGLVAGAAGVAAAFWLLGGILVVAAAAVARRPG
jgi:hypothetical protein